MDKTGVGYISSQTTVDLRSGLKISDEIDPDEIRFRIVQGSDATVSKDGILTFAYTGVVTVEVFVGNESDPTYRADVRIAWFE